VGKKRVAEAVLGAFVVLAFLEAAVWFGPWGNDRPTQPGAPTVDQEDPAVIAAQAFATAWEEGLLDEIAFAEGSGDVGGATALITAPLTVHGEAQPTVELVSVTPIKGDETRAVAAAMLTWDLGADHEWNYETRIPLVDQDSTWAVAWRPAVVEPTLEAGETLRATRVSGLRGDILDGSGQALTEEIESVVVGIEPGRSTDPEATARTVASLLGADADALAERVAASGPEEFVEVVALPRAECDQVRNEIQPLPGTVFREETLSTDLPTDYARGVLGATGPATEEIAESSQGRVVESEITGLSGLQLAQDEVLGGRPGVTVAAVGSDEGSTPRVLESFPAMDGESITVTLDSEVQSVADGVLANTSTPSALVAIEVSTGDVLAVANGPSGDDAFNRAMIGRYPPGSVFKVPSTLALLQTDLTPDTVVDCPPTATVGRPFRNAGGFSLGEVPFRTDFARSCNTAFVGQADSITPADLALSAASLGYRELDVGAPLFGGSVPDGADAAEHAAQMIGQGRVEASPFAVALASASVARGSSLNPRLIVDPSDTNTDSDTDADAESDTGSELPAEEVAELRVLMRLVVTEGTGSALADVPGEEVAGKTGTAEYGTANPPRTHAWFTGYQGDIAFAVLVEDGDAGGAVAAPIAADFLTLLADA
jgi:cell division protein FtsI/penicillin-binding protein 2